MGAGRVCMLPAAGGGRSVFGWARALKRCHADLTGTGWLAGPAATGCRGAPHGLPAGRDALCTAVRRLRQLRPTRHAGGLIVFKQQERSYEASGFQQALSHGRSRRARLGGAPAYQQWARGPSCLPVRRRVHAMVLRSEHVFAHSRRAPGRTFAPSGVGGQSWPNAPICGANRRLRLQANLHAARTCVRGRTGRRECCQAPATDGGSAQLIVTVSRTRLPSPIRTSV